jgi:hypothetical protein
MVADLLTKLLKPTDKGPRGSGAKLVTVDNLLALARQSRKAISCAYPDTLARRP